MALVRVDLPVEQLDLVKEILARNGVGAEHRPMLFGSRVTGHARRYSDLDIGLAGTPLPARRLAQVREDLEESRLAITVDVLNLSEVSPVLRDHALASAVPLRSSTGVPA